MQGMRTIDRLMSSLSLLASFPAAERGYEELASYYQEIGRVDDAEAVRFLISEKFRANDPDNNKEQRQDIETVS